MRAMRVVMVSAALLSGGAAFGASSAAAQSAGLVHAGRTSQQLPMFVRLNATRTRIDSMVWTYNVVCTPGAGAPEGSKPYRARFSELPWRKIKITAGKWRVNVTQNWRDGNERAAGTYVLSGRRSGDYMRGTLNVKIVYRNADGQVVTECRTTKPITFALRNLGWFGGVSEKGGIVTAGLSGDRRTITRLEWRWRSASCTFGPAADESTSLFATIDEVFWNIRLNAAGSWKGTVRYPTRVIDGMRISWTYPLEVQRVGSYLKGTARAVYTEHSASSGALIRRCTTGPVRFSIRD